MISILLATYNGEKYIKESIDSIINQTFTEWELLVGFNGTTDSSKKIVNKYNNSRIRVFDYGNDKGKAKTLNKLIQEAKYEWCAIQDDDDIWLPKKLELQMVIANSGKYDIIGSRIFYCNELGEIIGQINLLLEHEEILNSLKNGNNQIANSSAIFKKECAFQVGGWSEPLDQLAENGYQPLEDFDFWLKLMRSGKKFINIPEELVYHRLHSNSNFNTKKYNLEKIINQNDK